MLSGDRGRKNGEKKLRHYLINCPEWVDTDKRNDLANRLEVKSPDDKQLSCALRSKDPTALRKRHLILLCREWRYRSDLWVLKRGADAPAAVEATHDAAASAPNGGTSTIIPIMDVINVESLARNLSLETVLQYFESLVRPLLAVAAHYVVAPTMRQLAQATGSGGRIVTDTLLKRHSELVSVYAIINSRVSANRATVTAWHSQIMGGQAGATAQSAFQALQGRLCPAEETLQVLRAASAVALAHTRELEHRLRSSGPLEPVEAAWISDLVASSNASLEFMARSQTLLAQLLFSPFILYIQVAKLIMEVCEQSCVVQKSKLEERIQWMTELLNNGAAQALMVSSAAAAATAGLVAATTNAGMVSLDSLGAEGLMDMHGSAFASHMGRTTMLADVAFHEPVLKDWL